MASSTGSNNALVLSRKSQDNLIKYCSSILEAKRKFTQFTDKLTAVDVAYACYKVPPESQEQPTDGVDLQKLIPTDDTTVPVIASQVDSVVAYLIEVFLTGYPMFPVVSTPNNKTTAEKFEAVVDNHATKGRYARQFQILFRDAAKYNFCGLEGRWTSIAEFSAALAASFSTDNKPTLATRQLLTLARRIDPYNAIWDYRVDPADVAEHGEYGGYVELMGRIKLKRLLNDYSANDEHMNVKNAIKSKLQGIGENAGTNIAAAGKPITYVEKPQVSQYVNSEAYAQGGTWLEWMEGQTATRGIYPGYSNMYEVATIYARIIPSEHGIVAPRANTPQIWKLQVVNEQVLIYARPELTPHDRLPVLFGQPIEDGFSYQTRSIGEAQIPFQNTTSDLFNIRINSAKRSINDRGIYDSQLIDMADINSKVPAAKIPVRNLKMGKTLKDAYQPIPFQDGSTTGAMQDMQQTLQMSNMLFGINPFRQGQSVKGNRTLGEFESIDNSADLRSRMLALMLETQIFMPFKDTIKLNILLHRDQIEVLNFNTGESFIVDPTTFLTAVIEFKIADGYTPKAKLASTQQLQLAFQALQQMPAVQAGYNMPDMFAHLMTLMGVKNLAQYQWEEGSKEAIIAQALQLLPEVLQAAQQQGMLGNGTSQGSGQP